MKTTLPLLIVPLLTSLAFAAPAPADMPTNPPALKPLEDSAYTSTIEKRTMDIVNLLELKDAAVTAKVHDVIINQYRVLNTWHEANDAKLKELKKTQGTNQTAEAKAQLDQIQGSLKTIHDTYLAKLSALLTPEQVEKVKDKMTYGKVQFTMNGYKSAYPDLAEAEQAHILGMLKEARELAIDGGSADEKTAIFTKYKGKINNYLSSQGRSSKPKKPATNEPAAKQ